MEALSGGVLDLSSVQSIIDTAANAWFPTPDSVYIRSNGAGSLIDLSSLSSYSNPSGHLGEFTAVSTGRINISAGLTLLEGTLVTVNSGGAIYGSLQIGTNSLLTGGDGTIVGNVLNRNRLRPGTSVGRLSIDGNYTQAVTGTLEITIGGTAAGISFDQLVVTGTATLDGTLALQAANNFDPALNSTYSVVTYGSHIGEFAVITGTTPVSGKIWQANYQSGQLSIVTAAPLRRSGSDSQPADGEYSGLNLKDVTPLLDEARRRWQSAGYSGNALNNTQIRVVDLPGATLGFGGAGIIWLDVNAAGAGWYIDATPENDDEFLALSLSERKAASGIDLLTVLMHEMGHLIGLGNQAPKNHSVGVMDEELSIGTRISPLAGMLDDLFSDSDWL